MFQNYHQTLFNKSSDESYVFQVVSLSDLFAEREQYEWMLDTLFEVYKSHPGEDEIAMQYLNVAICKAAAVVGVVSMFYRTSCCAKMSADTFVCFSFFIFFTV